MTTDEQFMTRALLLAANGLGRTRPNPAVGCVLVRDGVVLGEGWHRQAGLGHAEVEALGIAGDARGATAYVTLEPCSHHGRTPPCANALVNAGVARVVVGAMDPNPEVSGRGIEKLRAAGIEMTTGVLENECREINRAFFKFIRTRQPWVVAKWAMTLDGKIATHTGHSRWITGDASRTRVHQLRNELDAILVGAGTARMDNPELTCRLPEGRNPIRVVLDSKLSLDPNSRIFDSAGTLVFCGSSASSAMESPFVDKGATVIRVAHKGGGLDLRAVLSELGQRNVMSVLVEGGGAVLGSFFDDRLVDRVMTFVSPKIVGGQAAPSPLAGHGISSMDQAVRLSGTRYESLGDDLLIIGDVEEECSPV